MIPIRSLPDLERDLAPERALIVSHAIYGQLATVDDVRLFMERHIFAVWDFMSLLKSLQRAFTCVEVPWVPTRDPLARRLVNEIVLAEETDEGGEGAFASHFELYRAAMQQCGADVSCIDRFVDLVRCGVSVRDALARANAPSAARRFVSSTFETIESGSLPCIAAAFTLGREEIIPAMFTRLLADLSRRSGGRLALFLDYLDRHVRIDGERHGPMSARLLSDICGTSDARWQEAFAGARNALVARRGLWDGIAAVVGRVPTSA